MIENTIDWGEFEEDDLGVIDYFDENNFEIEDEYDDEDLDSESIFDEDPDLGDQSFENFIESWDGEFPDED